MRDLHVEGEVKGDKSQMRRDRNKWEGEEYC